MTTLIYIHEEHKLTLYARRIKRPDAEGHANAVSAAGTTTVSCLWRANIQMGALSLKWFLQTLANYDL